MPQSASPVVRTQKIIVNPTSRSVSIINAGPLGPPGTQGPQGPQGIQGPTGPGATDPAVYTRLDSVEGVNTTQDGRITSNENTNTWQGAEISGLTNRVSDLESAAVGMTPAGTPVGATNWTYVASAAVKTGNVLTWRLRVTRANSALAIDGKGSFLAETIGTLPAEWRAIIGGAFVASGAHLNGRVLLRQQLKLVMF